MKKEFKLEKLNINEIYWARNNAWGFMELKERFPVYLNLTNLAQFKAETFFAGILEEWVADHGSSIYRYVDLNLDYLTKFLNETPDKNAYPMLEFFKEKMLNHTFPSSMLIFVSNGGQGAYPDKL